jgi:hypothetical protein
VQLLYTYLSAEGHSNEWIINKFIEPKLMVGRTAFYEYLELPARAYLKKQLAGDTYIRDVEQLADVYKYIYEQMDNKKRIK